MKSNTAILIGCWTFMILGWTTDMFPGMVVPAAFCGSYLLMWMFGAFKKENMFHTAQAKESSEHQLSDRQKDFQHKLAKAKEQELIDEITKDLDTLDVDLENAAVIKMVDQNGTHSTIIIRPDGEILIDGDPDPEIVEAAKMLKETVLVAGPEAVAKEIGKQIEAMNRGEK